MSEIGALRASPNFYSIPNVSNTPAVLAVAKPSESALKNQIKDGYDGEVGAAQGAVQEAAKSKPVHPKTSSPDLTKKGLEGMTDNTSKPIPKVRETLMELLKKLLASVQNTQAKQPETATLPSAQG